MKTQMACPNTLTGVALLVALSLVPAAALAQEAQPALEQVVVVAPRVVPERERHIGATTVTSVSTLQATVSYADLDLTRTADVGELERRVEAAANRVCEALAKEVPFGEPKTAECVRDARDEAQEQIKLLVDKTVGS